MKGKPFIAVSPDLQIDCVCCGKGLVEIKCPYSVRETVPSSDNLGYLEDKEGKPSLKKNTDYYYQIQGQMGVTGRCYTDLVVFTSHGSINERIKFDKPFWLSMLVKLEWFWNNSLCPELLYENAKQAHLLDQAACTPKHNKTAATSGKENDPPSLSSSTGFKLLSKVRSGTASGPSPKNAITSNSKISSVPATSQQNPSKKKKRAVKQDSRKKSKVGEVKRSIYLCGVCQKDCVEKPKQFSEESVACDGCPLWHHFVCVGIKKRSHYNITSGHLLSFPLVI